MVLDSPLTMLCDSPTNYEEEEESAGFIASLPTTWDETKILAGELGEYIITARRKDNKWYIGGITNWTPRTLSVDLSFLNNKQCPVTIIRDGINADRNAEDYVKENATLSTDQLYQVHLAPGGGFAMVIED